jgi:hypothetical protein
MISSLILRNYLRRLFFLFLHVAGNISLSFFFSLLPIFTKVKRISFPINFTIICTTKKRGSSAQKQEGRGGLNNAHTCK